MVTLVIIVIIIVIIILLVGGSKSVECHKSILNAIIGGSVAVRSFFGHLLQITRRQSTSIIIFTSGIRILNIIGSIDGQNDLSTTGTGNFSQQPGSQTRVMKDMIAIFSIGRPGNLLTNLKDFHANGCQPPLFPLAWRMMATWKMMTTLWRIQY
jgi:hypothetical protein